MVPTVGRIIHVTQSALPCRAAIVTGLDYGTGKPYQMFLSVFSRTAPTQTVMTLPSENWHDPRDCPNMPLLTAWDGVERRLSYAYGWNGPERRKYPPNGQGSQDV